MFLTPPSGWKKPFTSLVVGADAGRGKAWASVARYDDAYVHELESKNPAGVTWGGVAGEGHYDSQKMFKSCGKMEATTVPREHQEEVSQHTNTTY
jgi:phosphatidylinositol-3,4,5-trisphosphate 3-phosphatase/dual-specificity protein phosphatase PTEN